jgi:hypothetical protein
MKSIYRTSTILARSNTNHNFNGKNVMSNNGMPDPNKIRPIAGYHALIYKIIYAKMTKTNPNNIISVSLLISLTQSLKVMLRMDGDRLIIGKFFQIETGVEFHEWSKSSNECSINISIL